MYFTDEQLKKLSEIKKVYSVKNIKTFRGMEGHGLNSTLCKNGKPLCNVDDDGNGGGYNFYSTNEKNPFSYVEEKKLDEELFKIIGKYKYSENDKMEFDFDASSLVDMLVDEFEEQKTFKRHCKSKTCFITTECQRGQFITMKVLYSDKVKQQLQAKYGDKLVEILNERFL